MAEWHFGPSQPPQFVQPSPQPNGEALLCDHCGQEFKQGEAAIEVLPGKAGIGERSGRPMIVDDNQSVYPQANLHPHCVYGFVHDLDEMIETMPERVDLTCEACGLTVGEVTGYMVGDVYCSDCASKLNGDD